MSLWLAWANRLGPGMHCQEIDTGVRCDQTLWTPAPLLIVGLLLVVGSVTGFALARRRPPLRRV